MGTTAAAPVVYRGYRNANAAGPRLVTVERGGQLVGPLRHVVRHSPTGFGWGYAGSGPADLARSLLLDALGEAARCPRCAGTGQLAYPDGDPDAGPDAGPVLYEAAKHGGGGWQIEACAECDGGYLPVPYQQFKFDVVTRLPDTGWVLGRAEILDWLRHHSAL